jgi:hypothetical protein
VAEQAIGDAETAIGLHQPPEGRLADVAVEHDRPLAVQGREAPKRDRDRRLALGGTSRRDRDDPAPLTAGPEPGAKRPDLFREGRKRRIDDVILDPPPPSAPQLRHEGEARQRERLTDGVPARETLVARFEQIDEQQAEADAEHGRRGQQQQRARRARALGRQRLRDEPCVRDLDRGLLGGLLHAFEDGLQQLARRIGVPLHGIERDL